MKTPTTKGGIWSRLRIDDFRKVIIISKLSGSHIPSSGTQIQAEKTITGFVQPALDLHLWWIEGDVSHRYSEGSVSLTCCISWSS